MGGVAVGRRTEKGTRTPMYTACLRCGFGQNVHDRTPGACPKWVGGICWRCGDWCFRKGGICRACLARGAELGRMSEAAWRASPEYAAQRERKEQRKWLRQGKRTLTDLRQLLRDRGL